MNQRQIIAVAFLLLLAAPVFGQQRVELRGNVINSVTEEPLTGVLVTLKGQNQSERTDSRGEFSFMSVAAGDYVVTLSGAGIISREFSVNTEQNTILLLKDIKVVVDQNHENQAMVGMIEDTMLDDDDGGGSQEISSMVILSNDVFLNVVGYQLSAMRFRVRGYERNYEEKYINGVSFNDQHRGVFNFAAIGALNDLTRNGDAVNYNSHGTFTFGTIGGTENINMRAGSYAKGGKLTASYTNRNYYLRGMASYSTGLRDDGWAFTIGVGGRYSDEGNIKGTFYRNISYALAVEKQWDEGRHSLSFTTFGSPVERGQNHASFQEAYDLTGKNLYNPDWGYQDGKKRNSRVVKAYDPTGILSHVWKINQYTTLTTGAALHYGRYGNTALNWYDGIDPRPDYYRYLPSYYREDEQAFDVYTQLWENKDKSVTQINWDNLYRANELANQAGEKTIYMVEERRSDLFEGSFNSTLNAVISDKHKLTAGVGARKSQSRQFKTVDDLLGGSYVLDIDKFAERDFHDDKEIIQNDLNKPDRRVYEGDRFGYDFRIDINSANIWMLNQYTTQRIDFYYGTKLKYTEFRRDGKMRNGRYPDSSDGKGKNHRFVDYALKGGITYKFSGRHFITGNVSYMTEAPLPNNAYISPRITDRSIDGLEAGRVFSADVNYIFSTPRLNGRVSVFQTNFYDQMLRKSYYFDSDRTFVNHVLSGMSKVNRGVELGVKYRMNNNWSFDLVGTIAEYYYSNNPDGVISYENGKIADVEEKVYMEDYYVGSTPQIAGVFGINYFYNYWFIEAKVNGFARNYIDIAPMRRLASNYVMGPNNPGVDPANPTDMDAYHKLTDQERYGSGYTVDFSIGKMFYLPRRHSLNFNLSVNNIFNRENVKTGGYENGRLDTSYPDKFGAKYYYMQGINCFLNVSYRF